MGHIHDVYDDDKHFIIDPVTRRITYAESDKLILIQNDHNSERYTFEIPKMIEGHDMSNCDKVEIHYLNSDVSATNKAPGVYQAEDVQVVEDTVVFSWLISRNATKYSGFLMFAINFECLAEDGTVDYAWATTPFENVRILSSMHNTETVLEPYPDIIEQMRLELIDKVTPKKGVDYFDGVNGKSAYQIAVDNGFIGTEAEWLASLRGADGKDGMQPDWNQNDYTQPDYVKNRPFWREKTKELTFPEITEPIDVTTEGDGSGFFGANGLFGVVPDVTNYVVFDGVEYACEPYYSEEAGGISIGSSDFKDYPFFIFNGIILTKTAGNHTVLQYYDVYTIHTDYTPHLVIRTLKAEDGKPYLAMEDVEKIKVAFKNGVPIKLDTSYQSSGFKMRVYNVTDSFIYASGFGSATYNDIMTQAEFTFFVSDGSLKSYSVSYSGSIVENGSTYPLMYINNKRYKITVDDSGTLTATKVT